MKTPAHILLRSSWQTVNIGDIAHTPGMLALLQKHLPDALVTLWPSNVSGHVADMLQQRFPKLTIALTPKEKAKAFEVCDFFLHGSGPFLVGGPQMADWQTTTQKPSGIGGVTLSQEQARDGQALVANSEFALFRDSISVEVVKCLGIKNPMPAFVPDATFYLDLRDDAKADEFLDKNDLRAKEFACFVGRLRYTPYWESKPGFAPEETARKTTINQEHAENDHAKIRQAIVTWVRETGKKALLCPEMSYMVDLMRPLLFDPLPDDVKPKVVVRPDYWLTDEAASTYARASAVVSIEMHSPIIACANNTPAIHVRQPSDTSKGQMWRDVGFGEWMFEIESCTGKEIADALLRIHRKPNEAEQLVSKAQRFVDNCGREMMEALTN